MSAKANEDFKGPTIHPNIMKNCHYLFRKAQLEKHH